MSTHAVDTWGIPSEDFLYGYIAVSATLMVLTLGWRLMIRARRHGYSTEHGYSAEQLTPPEVGMLTGESRAIAASLAILRSADLITTDGAVLRPLGPGDETLDWYTLTVYQRLAQQALPHRRRQLAERMTVETARLRNSLADRGYLTSDSARRSIFLSTVPLKILVAVGIVRHCFRTTQRQARRVSDSRRTRHRVQHPVARAQLRSNHLGQGGTFGTDHGTCLPVPAQQACLLRLRTTFGGNVRRSLRRFGDADDQSRLGLRRRNRCRRQRK